MYTVARRAFIAGDDDGNKNANSFAVNEAVSGRFCRLLAERACTIGIFWHQPSVTTAPEDRLTVLKVPKGMLVPVACRQFVVDLIGL